MIIQVLENTLEENVTLLSNATRGTIQNAYIKFNAFS
jgi:hypothetical protein